MNCPEPIPFDARAYLAAAAPAIGLPVPDGCRDGTAANLDRTFRFAALLLAFDGLDRVEPAPVFNPLGDGP